MRPLRVALLLLLLLASPPLVATAGRDRSAGTARMGDAVPGGGWLLTVRSVERVPSARAGDTGMVARVAVDLTNLAGAPRRPNLMIFRLLADDHRAPPDQLIGRPSSVAAGGTATFALDFAIPKAAGRLTLEFAAAPARPIRLDECHCDRPSPTDPRPQW